MKEKFKLFSCFSARSLSSVRSVAKGCCFPPRRTFGFLLLTFHFLLSSATFVAAAAPEWWITRGVINTNLPPNDYGPVNQGQLKHVATQAFWELEEKLPNGAGDTLGDLVFGFAVKTNSNYLPVNLGQLKYVAKPFYDRLIDEGYAEAYPWTATKADDNSYAAANIGQLKYLFSFDLDQVNPPNILDSDNDGLPDAWEIENFGNLDPLPEEDPDGDGQSNQEEQENDTDPNDPNPPDSEDIPDYAMVDFGLEGMGLKINEAGDLVGRKSANFFTIHKGQVQYWPGNVIHDLNEKGDILLSPMDNGEGNSTLVNLENGEVTQLGEWNAPEPSEELLQKDNLISYSYQGLKSKRAYALNDSQQVLGYAIAMWKYTYWYLDEDDQYQEETSDWGDYVALLWSPSEGQKINFNPDYGYWADGQEGFSINEQGAFVAGWYDNELPEESVYSHYWASAPAPAQLLDLHSAYSINSQGLIAGQKDFMAWLVSADNSTDLVLGPGYATSVNDDGNVLVNNYDDKAFLVRKNPETQKYEKFALTQALPEDDSGQMTMANDITKNGLIAGQVLKEGQKKAGSIFPAQLGVDANRDGKIVLLNEKDEEGNVDEEVDITSSGKEFRFWSNEDDDTNDGDNAPPQQPDNLNTAIDCKKDLEDFSRLWIYLKGVHEMVKGNDAMLVGLKFKDVTEGTPVIRLFEAAENDGDLKYLNDEGVATQQSQGKYGSAVQGKNGETEINKYNTFIFKPEIWEQLDEENYKKYFLFEGVEEGEGKLQIVFLNKDEEEIGEAPPIYLEISNIKDMYEQGYALPLGLLMPYETLPPFDNNSPSMTTTGGNFEKPWDETEECVLFVHGWNMTPEGSAAFSETMFKRLWQRGYKGRFASFRWDTMVGETTFNRSEYRAWKYGKSLKDYVNNLKGRLGGYTINLTAHSMGNIVVGSALKKGAVIDNYVLMQGAISASCYDIDPGLFYGLFVADEVGSPTPDLAQDLGYRGYLYGVNGNLVNFYNEEDDALTWAWNANNSGFKPDKALEPGDYKYSDNKPKLIYGQNEPFTSRDVTDPHESMSFVARSRTKVVGAEGQTAAVIKDSFNLNANYGFDGEHSAQFVWHLQKKAGSGSVWNFYEKLSDSLGVTINP